VAAVAGRADHRVLRERGITATVVLLVVVVFGLIFTNNDLIPPPFNSESTKIVTRFAILSLAIIPAAYWLILYRNAK
jgi:hypothetical protein